MRLVVRCRCIVLVAFCALGALTAQPPAPLGDMLFGLKRAVPRALRLGPTPCSAVFALHGPPLLVWAADASAVLPPAQERDAVRAWLARHGPALGHGAFQPVFVRTDDWHGHEVWVFGLERDGTPLFDAEVRAFWGETGLLGLFQRVPPLANAPVPPRAGTGDLVYHVQREDGALVLAERRRSATPTHDVTDIVVGDRVLHRLMDMRAPPPPAVAAITEFTFPGMNFPDQIATDSRGIVWFSEPLVNRVTSFDPTTGAFRSYGTAPWSLPDGLSVDDQDRVWTGFNGGTHGLGVIDAHSGLLRRFAAPYSGAGMAIPTRSNSGTIWVTDHGANRISELDPVSGEWRRSVTMLTGGAYPVAATLEPESGDLFIPLYTANRLARVRPNGAVTEYPAPSLSGPSFAGVHGGKVFFTYWSAGRLGEFDTRTGGFVDHQLISAETCGPMAVGQNGHVYVGTRNRGYIVDFDPGTRTFSSYLIPTTSPGLKDGLAVAPDGTVWFTESGRNKIAKLVLP